MNKKKKKSFNFGKNKRNRILPLGLREINQNKKKPTKINSKIKFAIK